MTTASTAEAGGPRWLPPREVQVALVSGLALLLTWSPKLEPNFLSADDLARLHEPGLRLLFELVLRQGRPGLAALYQALVSIGVDPTRSGTLLNWLTLPLLAVTSVLVMRCWRAEGMGVLPFVCAP